MFELSIVFTDTLAKKKPFIEFNTLNDEFPPMELYLNIDASLMTNLATYLKF
jgi:hypothetical protein